jgi:hypothetical protein
MAERTDPMATVTVMARVMRREMPPRTFVDIAATPVTSSNYFALKNSSGV